MEIEFEPDVETNDEADLRERQEVLRLLAQIRKKRGISQAEVVDRMGLKSQSAVSQLENADDIRFSTLTRYARALGVAIQAELVPVIEEEPS